jgi:PilZ domain
VKRLGELTIEDLTSSPVWRYEGGSGDAALVSPARRRSLSQTDDEIFLAATEFDLSDSTRHGGFCFPAEGSGIDYLQPVIVTRTGHVTFWFERPASAETLAKQWRALDREAKRIFPVAFRCLVPVDGKVVAGRIEGVETSQDLAPPAEPAGHQWPPLPRRPGIGTKETRVVRRRRAEMTVEFTQGSLRGTGVTGDISRRGMFVRSNLVPGTGPVLRLTVNLPGGRKLALTGRVVRSVDTGERTGGPTGFGLRLVDDWPEYDEIFGKRHTKK